MTNTVTLNGNSYHDGTTPPGNMGNGGHRDNLIPMLADAVVDLAAKQSAAAGSADAAAASALAAINAPGTSATSTTSLTIGTGSKTLTIQTGKAFAVGQPVSIARTADATNWMAGVITAHDSGTGAMMVSVTSSNGSGTFTDWTVALAALPAVAGGKVAHWVSAAQMTPRTTNGAAVGSVQSSSGIMAATLDFDPATQEYAQFSLKMPKRWDLGTVTAKVAWSTVQAPSVTYSYTHAYGSGNRAATVTGSTTFTLGGGSIAALLNGNTADNGAYVATGESVAGKEIKFVFSAPVAINQVKFYCETSVPSIGVFSWQGSNDGTNWTTLDTNITLMSAGGTTTYNVTPGLYSQYRFLGTSGTSGTGHWISEVEFQASTYLTIDPTWGVAWALRAVALSDTDPLTTSFGTTVTLTDQWQNASSAMLLTSESSAISIGNTPAAEDCVVFEISRDVAHTADTLPEAKARIHGLTLIYNATTGNDN